MAAPPIVVEGLERVLKALHNLTTGIPAATGIAARQTAAAGARLAQLRAPRRSGRLAASITAGPAEFGTPLIYAAPIVYGWRARNISPNGFLTDTTLDLAAPALRIHETALKTIIRKTT